MAGSATAGNDEPFFAEEVGTVADMVTVLDTDLYGDGLRQGYADDVTIDLLVARESAWLHAHATYRAPLGVKVDIPDGYVGLIVPRSSTANSGIQVPIVAIDPGYTGEIGIWLTSHEPTRYTRGQALVGLLVVPVVPPGAIPKKDGARGDGNLASSDTKGTPA
jgi:dUTPase